MYPAEVFHIIYVDIPSPRRLNITPHYFLVGCNSDFLPKGALWRVEEKE